MATWKKVIVFGSNAELRHLSVDTHVSASLFSGSFVGDGSGLTGLAPSAISSYTNSGNDRIITSVDASTVNGEANLTFNGSLLTVTGRIDVTTSITGSTIQLSSLPTLVDNTVLVVNSSGRVGTDEIDPRVWGSTLVDGSGAATRIPIWSDADTLTSDAELTYNTTTNVLSIGNSTYGDDVVIAGNLTVLGSTVNQNVANLSVEDRFILLNSGSATGDGGIVVQTESNFTGAAFGWDDSATRWSLQVNTKLSGDATAITPDAYVAAVVDIDNGMADISAHQLNGNIKIDSGEIYIYS